MAFLRRLQQQRFWATVAGVAALGGVAVAVGACSSDGRAMAPPQAWQTTTTRPLPPTSALDSEASSTGLALTSPDFEPGGPAPVDVLCTGANRFPSLEFHDVPDNAVELAVTLSDQTDPENPLLHWLVAGISPTETGITAGELPPGAFDTLNDYGNSGFGAPCLDEVADGPKDLQFRVYVLENPSGLAPGDPGNEAWNTLRAMSTDSASVLMRLEIT